MTFFGRCKRSTNVERCLLFSTRILLTAWGVSLGKNKHLYHCYLRKGNLASYSGIFSWTWTKSITSIYFCKKLLLVWHLSTGVFIADLEYIKHINPASILFFKVNSRNTRKRCEICSKLSIKICSNVQW